MPTLVREPFALGGRSRVAATIVSSSCRGIRRFAKSDSRYPGTTRARLECVRAEYAGRPYLRLESCWLSRRGRSLWRRVRRAGLALARDFLLFRRCGLHSFNSPFAETFEGRQQTSETRRTRGICRQLWPRWDL